ncbi:MAG: glycyl-radical enzyme activating protein [Faecalibacterium sp.]
MQEKNEISTVQTAMVSNIQRCSVHDGPGIRTTIFLKGCNMHCQWCHNPETISFAPEYLRYPEKCIGCNMCEQGCFSGARVLCGKEMSVQEIVKEAMLDKAYYAQNGGVTISGGEPTCQAAQTVAVLQALRAQGVHTAIESNLYCTKETLAQIVAQCNLVMCDLKIFDDEKHRQYTGVSNQRVLENIAYLLTLNLPVIIRTPLIAGVNDSPEEIRALTAYLSGLPGSAQIMYYELLPYHSLGLSKESENNQHIAFAAPGKAAVANLAQIAKRQIPTVFVAGVSV